MTLARTIRRARFAAGHTLAYVAARAGCSRPFVAHVEAGRKLCSERIAVGLAEALGRRPEELVALLLQDRLDAAGVRMTVRVEVVL